MEPFDEEGRAFRHDTQGNPQHLFRLRNYGTGTALETKVTITVKDSSTKAGGSILKDEFPVGHILPGEANGTFYLPKFVRPNVDEEPVDYVGTARIECRDIHGQLYYADQSVRILLSKQNGEPSVMLAFGGINRMNWAEAWGDNSRNESRPMHFH